MRVHSSWNSSASISELIEVDELVVEMKSAVDRFVGDQNASKNFVLTKFAADDSTGAYPQANLDKSKKYLEDDGHHYRDRFPTIYEPIVLRLNRSAKWTDVLSAQLWSEGYLLSERALEVFEKFDLGRTKKYTAEVRKGKEARKYTYLFLANHVVMEDVNFSKSEFYIANMIGSPQSMIKVTSDEDYEQKRSKAASGELDGFGEFSRLDCKCLKFKRGRVPKSAIFGLGQFGVDMYFRQELYVALRQSNISGFEFRRNNKLFD